MAILVVFADVGADLYSLGEGLLTVRTHPGCGAVAMGGVVLNKQRSWRRIG